MSSALEADRPPFYTETCPYPQGNVPYLQGQLRRPERTATLLGAE
jgi:hypothetical protein